MPDLSARAAQRRSALIRFFSVVGIFVLIGGLLGVLWQAISPDPVKGVLYQGSVYATNPSKNSFTATGVFVLLSAGFGLISGALAGWWTRRWPVTGMFATALGALLAPPIGYLVGHSLGPSMPSLTGLKDGSAVQTALTLGGVDSPDFFPIPDAVLMVMMAAAVAAAAAYHLLAGIGSGTDHHAPWPPIATAEGAEFDQPSSTSTHDRPLSG